MDHRPMPAITGSRGRRPWTKSQNANSRLGELISNFVLRVSLAILMTSSGSWVVAQQPIADGLLGRKARIEAAMQSIPFDRIDGNASQAIRDVLDNPSFYRQLPPKKLEADPALLKFMVRHPEVMVNIWEMIGITNIEAKRTGNRTFYANDGAGTTCNCELVYSDDVTHVYYGTGNYDGPLSPRAIKGRVVCVLSSTSQKNPLSHSGYVVDSRMDVFLRVDNLGADLITRTLGPLIGKVTEHNFDETSKFVGQLSQFCAAYPTAAQNLAASLNVNRESIRQEFATIATRIASQQGNALARQLSLSALPATEHALPVDSTQSALPSAELTLTDSGPSNPDPADLRTELGQVRIATLPEVAQDSELSDHESGRTSLDANRSSKNPVMPNQPTPIVPRRSTLQLRR